MVAEVSDDPLIGATISHYTIDGLAGEGGMGRVYLAHHSRLAHRRIALKVLLGDLAATMATRLRFTQEAESASRLDHPNCVSVVDFGRTDRGLLYLAMEYVDGRALSAVIDEGGPMEATRVIALARQIAAGLDHAHGLGLVHRDLKPDNILVTTGPSGELPRIVDFGLAISSDASGDAPRLTTIGIAVGTPTYASPEQTQGIAIDHRADLFALGVTMFEMLAGTLPYDGNVAEIVHRNTRGETPAIASRAPGVHVPTGLEELVRRLMAPSQDVRPQSAAEVIAELDRIVNDPAAVVQARTRRRWGLVAAVVTAAIVSVAVGTFTAEPTAPPNEPVIATEVVTPDAGISPSTLVAPDDALVAIRPADPMTKMAPAADAGVTGTVTRSQVTNASERGTRRQPSITQVARRDPPANAESPPAAEPLSTVLDAGVVDRRDVLPPITSPRETLPPPVDEPPRPPPLPRSARVAYEQVEVRGSLTRGSVVRALERTTAALRACYVPAANAAQRAPALALGAALVFDEYGVARDVRVADARLATLSTCVSTVLASTRSDTAPDVGTVSVRFVVRFTPEVP